MNPVGELRQALRQGRASLNQHEGRTARQRIERTDQRINRDPLNAWVSVKLAMNPRAHSA
jgi:hypothetical protein